MSQSDQNSYVALGIVYTRFRILSIFASSCTFLTLNFYIKFHSTSKKDPSMEICIRTPRLTVLSILQVNSFTPHFASFVDKRVTGLELGMERKNNYFLVFPPMTMEEICPFIVSGKGRFFRLILMKFLTVIDKFHCDVIYCFWSAKTIFLRHKIQSL